MWVSLKLVGKQEEDPLQTQKLRFKKQPLEDLIIGDPPKNNRKFQPVEHNVELQKNPL